MLKLYTENECRDLLDVFNQKVADKQADVLYVLTFATIFMAPLQLMSGIYGMNFDYIPELQMHGGYLYFWGVSLSLMLILAAGFIRLGWMQNPFGGC